MKNGGQADSIMTLLKFMLISFQLVKSGTPTTMTLKTLALERNGKVLNGGMKSTRLQNLFQVLTNGADLKDLGTIGPMSIGKTQRTTGDSITMRRIFHQPLKNTLEQMKSGSSSSWIIIIRLTLMCNDA